jgi:Zn-dependent protease with chaperone function
MECRYCSKTIETLKPVIYQGETFCNNLCRRNFEKSIAPSEPVQSKSAFEQMVSPLQPAEAGPDTDQPVRYQVRGKEYLYLYLKVIFTLAILGGLGFFGFTRLHEARMVVLTVVSYAFSILLFLLVQRGLLIGWIRGNAVRITEKQFPDIFEMLRKESARLRMKRVPELYVMQAGGALNAFATRFVGRNYVVLFSDIMETAYEKGPAALSFIIGHELGHIKRRHLLKSTLLLPSIFVPFLEWAYSRACEYTCDNIGKALSPAGANDGMLILAVGKQLYRKVNLSEYVTQLKSAGGFWVWFAEKFSTHPHLPKRLHNLGANS